MVDGFGVRVPATRRAAGHDDRPTLGRPEFSNRFFGRVGAGQLSGEALGQHQVTDQWQKVVESFARMTFEIGHDFHTGLAGDIDGASCSVHRVMIDQQDGR
jgi:hypothetical protein